MLYEQVATSSIFDRLPEEIFRPLASPNRRQFWALLIHLYDQFFSPDAAPLDEDGLLHRSVTMEIERFIERNADWVDEDGESVETPLNVRANLALARLVECGWLREERVGVRTFLDMHPTVQKFLELLWQFAEEGPQFIGGKVQLIYNQLIEVTKQPSSQAGGFSEAAKQARHLVGLLKNTAIRVKDVLDSLSQNDSTAAYIRAFFSDYISSIFIRDYHDLRTDNHPLRHRFEILAMVYDLRDDTQKREVLIDWYRAAHRLGSMVAAEELFERDVSRFLLLAQIETYLDRLDSSINRATRRAVAYINYSLRTRGHIDRLIGEAIKTAEQADGEGLPLVLGVPAGPLFCTQRLREPRQMALQPKRSAIRKRTITPEQRAIMKLRAAMNRRREITPRLINHYLASQIKAGADLTSESLKIRSINDLVSYASLARLGLAGTRVLMARQHPLARQLPHIQVALEKGQTSENEFLVVPRFTVRVMKGGR